MSVIGVTGGSGFIGSHVVDRLVAAGHRVVVLDVQEPHRPDVAYREVDARDLGALLRGTRNCDAVFHLAGVSNVNDALAAPVDTVTLNVVGTTNVWEACRHNQVGRAVLASTVWVYTGAISDGDTLDEEAPFHLPAAGHIYTSTKIACELVVHNYHDLYQQPFTILRYGIPFGPRMREELVIASFVRTALAKEAITIHGDGLQFRNYVYVEDLADAHVLALSEKAENEVFNLEGAEPVSIRRVAEAVREVLGTHIAIEFTDARPGDYGGKEVSGEKAQRVLGWAPSTSFEEGLRRYVEWYLEEQASSGERTSEA
jgi:UDP-glucose 4-epimerase